MKETTKKIFISIITSLLVLTLTGCGNDKQDTDERANKKPEVTGKVYDNGSGLTIRMAEGMEEDELEGYAMFYYGESCMMTALKETFEEFESVGYDAENSSLEDYCEIVKEANGLDFPFEKDSYGYPYISYINEVDGNNFTYYTTVRKGSDAFWLVTMACLEDEEELWLPQFEEWGSTITVE